MTKKHRIVVIILPILGIIVAAGWFTYRNSLTEITYCSDVCPDYTRTFKVYRSVDSQNGCEKRGGQTIKDQAWGGYIGCRPMPEDGANIVYE